MYIPPPVTVSFELIALANSKTQIVPTYIVVVVILHNYEFKTVFLIPLLKSMYLIKG